MENKPYPRLQKDFLDAMSVDCHPEPTLDVVAVRKCYDMVLEELMELAQEIIRLEDYVEKNPSLNEETVVLSSLPKNSVDRPFIEDLLANICAESCDLIYVLCQLCNRLGLDLDKMFRAIYKANMAKKTNGRIIKNAEGKVMKPKGWAPVNKIAILKGK